MKVILERREAMEAMGNYAADKLRLPRGNYDVNVKLDITKDPENLIVTVEITPKAKLADGLETDGGG